MKPMAAKYMFFVRSLSTVIAFATSAGLGVSGPDPSVGISPSSEIAGAYCALPKM